jgi:hypothetical protein
MTADLSSPLGHAGPCTLPSPDVPARSLIPGRLSWLLALTWPLPARHNLILFPVLPRPTIRPFSGPCTPVLVSYWLGGNSMGVDGFILSYGWANWSRVQVFYLPFVSYIYRFSGWKIILLATCLLAGFCWTSFFDPEDGGDTLLRNVGRNSTDYTASYPRRWCSTSVLLFNLTFIHSTLCSRTPPIANPGVILAEGSNIVWWQTGQWST